MESRAMKPRGSSPILVHGKSGSLHRLFSVTRRNESQRFLVHVVPTASAISSMI